MRVIVCYDIADDNKRRRLAVRLERFITRVQKSVFEGDISEKILERIRKISNREIDHATDSVRIYFLCKRCLVETEVIGNGMVVPTVKEDRII